MHRLTLTLALALLGAFFLLGANGCNAARYQIAGDSGGIFRLDTVTGEVCQLIQVGTGFEGLAEISCGVPGHML